MRKLPFLIAAIVCFTVSYGWGATVYVNKDGGSVYYESGAASCGEVTDADTAGDLEGALTAAGSGGILYICAGTYTGAELDGDGMLNATDWDQSIYNVGTVVVDGDKMGTYVLRASSKKTFNLIGSGGKGAFVFTGGIDHAIVIISPADDMAATIDGVTVNASNAGSIESTGIKFSGSAGNQITGTIKNSFIDDIGGMGIGVEGDIDGVIIEKNVIVATGDNVANTGQHGISVHATPTTILAAGGNWADEGSSIYSTAEASTVYDVANYTDNVDLVENDGNYGSLAANEWDYYDGNIYANIGAGDTDPDTVIIMYSTHQCDGVIVRYNNVSGVIDDDGVEGHGIAFDGFGTNSEAYGNVTSDNEGLGIQVNYQDSVAIYNNVIKSNIGGITLINPGTTVAINNNTIVGNTGAALLVRSGRTSVTAYNNIFKDSGTYGVNQESADGLILDYNLYDNNDSGNVNNVLQGANKVEADPLFTDQASGDFTLQSTSPAINTGTLLSIHVDGWTDYAGTTRLYGGSPDIGAYETIQYKVTYPLLFPFGHFPWGSVPYYLPWYVAP